MSPDMQYTAGFTTACLQVLQFVRAMPEKNHVAMQELTFYIQKMMNPEENHG